MGYGTSSYGTSSYGSVGPIYLGNAYAVSTNSVRVSFSVEPLNGSRIRKGDVLNPLAWTVSHEYQGVTVYHTVLSIVHVSEGKVFDVYVLESFLSNLYSHDVSADGNVDPAFAVQSPSGEILSNPVSMSFLGMSVEARSPGDPGHDLAINPETDGLAVVGGDYKRVHGIDLLKKLIIRRVMLRKGDFFHIPGFGSLFSLKTPVPGSEIIRRKTEMEMEIRQEPGVVDVSVKLTMTSSGVLYAIVTVQADSGEKFNISISENGSS